MKTLTVAQRLILQTGSLLLLLVALSLTGLWALHAADKSLQAVYADRTVPAAQLSEVRSLLQAEAQLAQLALLDTGRGTRNAAQLERNATRDAEVWAAYLSTTMTEEEQALIDRVKPLRESFVAEIHRPVLQALKSEDAASLRSLVMERMPERVAALDEGLKALVELQVRVAHEEYQAAVHRFERVTLAVELGLVLALLLGGGQGWLLVRRLRAQLGAEPQQAQAVAQRVAAGDLLEPVTLRDGDEHSLMAAMAHMRGALERTVGSVRLRADSVAVAASEIAQGNLDLSQRTEEQASALQQTAASMEQLSTSVAQNAENARQSSQLARKATSEAENGVTVVGQVMRTMQAIEASSRRVAEIISVIDGIAFQTNLLALNAAVEAARAGDQGRGFAVVAGEVRQLAQRAAEASRQVKELITSSVEQVQRGCSDAEAAGKDIEAVLVSIRRVSDLAEEISSASQEQSRGVLQIGQAVTQMDQVTQQNAALVEESSAAAESLRLQSSELLAAVSVFRVGEAPTEGAAPAPRNEGGWQGPERRSGERPKNIVRPNFGRAAPAGAKTQTALRNGSDGAWETF